ncbi:MAG: hypothetical protein ACREDL_04115, partial [Bradyrhizobium sp.]
VGQSHFFQHPHRPERARAVAMLERDHRHPHFVVIPGRSPTASEPGISTLFNSSPDTGFALSRASE